MENIKFNSELDDEREKFNKDFEKLKKISLILKEMGFEIREYALSPEEFKRNRDNGIEFPVVEDGAQGIRIASSKIGEIAVSFTNGFEDPGNHRRIEVEKKLKNEGLWNC